MPYDPGYVSGWVVEQYQIDLVAAAEHARRVMDGKVRAMCSQQVPGDTQRNLQVDADYSAQTFKHILVPVWLLAYNYGRQTYQVVINGVTGADRRQASLQLGEDRVRRPRRAHRVDDLRLAPGLIASQRVSGPPGSDRCAR